MFYVRDATSLRHTIYLVTLPKGVVVSSVIAEKTHSVICESMQWSRLEVPASKELFYRQLSGLPHTLVQIEITDEEAGEQLTSEEVVTLTAVMIARLEGEQCLDYNTIPVSTDPSYPHTVPS